MKFTDGYEKLKKDFHDKNIPIETPAFYDHRSFLNVEKNDPSFLINYAAYVAKQPYSYEYLQYARKVIKNATNLLYRKLQENGRLGACVDISGILSRILEEEGVWNCGIKGSLTITFPPKSKEEKTYFWSVDHGEFSAGHAWLFAPPFPVVDISIKLQEYSGKKINYIPNIVLLEKIVPAKVEIEDIISPSYVNYLRTRGVSKENYIDLTASQAKNILKVFPASYVKGLGTTKIKYCPVAIHASETPFKEVNNMLFEGKTPYELYEKYFKGQL